jgi:hypothetical protein
MTAQEMLLGAYAAFNNRDIEAALAFMSDTVSWPKASEGGRVVGKRAVQEYWIRQWAEFDPRVDVVELVARDPGQIEAKVHQVVRNLKGDVVSDTELSHIYTIVDGLIERMDIEDGEERVGPSSAFS